MRTSLKVIGVSALVGLLFGANLAVYNLSDFASVPPVITMVLMALEGGMIGLLIPSFSRSLVALLLVVVIGFLVSVGALAYPEMHVDRLGLQTAINLAIEDSLVNAIFMFPLLAMGLLLSKLVPQEERP